MAKKKTPKRTLAELDEIHDALSQAFTQVEAPIMDLVAAQTHDPYRILVGTILSARTKDAVTADAVRRLFPVAPTADALEALTVVKKPDFRPSEQSKFFRAFTKIGSPIGLN